MDNEYIRLPIYNAITCGVAVIDAFEPIGETYIRADELIKAIREAEQKEKEKDNG